MKQVQLAQIFLALQCFLVVTFCQLAIVPLTVLSGLLLSLAVKPTWRVNRRSWTLCLAGIASLLLLARLAVPHRADPVDWLLPTWALLPLMEFLLITQLLEFFRVRPRGVLPSYFPGWGLGVAICAFHKFVFFGDRRLFVLCAILFASLALVLFQLQQSEPRFHRRGVRSTDRTWVLGGAIFLASVLSWQAYELGSWVVPNLVNKIAAMSEPAFLGAPAVPTPSYRLQPDLVSVSEAQQTFPSDIALRVFSKREPGYFRSQAFDSFDGRRWGNYRSPSRIRSLRPLVPPWNRVVRNRNGLPTPAVTPMPFVSTDSTKQTIAKMAPEVVAWLEEEGFETSTDLEKVKLVRGLQGREQLFNLRGIRGQSQRPSANASRERYEVHPDPRRVGAVFTPIGTDFLLAKGVDFERTVIAVDNHGIVVAGIDGTRPYTLGMVDPGAKMRLSAAEKQILTRRLPRPHDQLSQLASRIGANLETVSDKIDVVESHFRADFQYSPSIVVPDNKDPMDYFLFEQRVGGTEYFATATALLLREMGVPCRYVTGLYVGEPSSTASLWLARNRDFHAWVEAYDESTEQWHIVDSSPRRAYRPRRHMAEMARRDKDDRKSDRLRSLNVGGVAESPWYRTWERFWATLLAAPLLLLVMAWMLFRYVRARERHMSDPLDWRKQVERQLKRQSLERRPAETLHQFVARAEQDVVARTDADEVRVLAVWLRRYAIALYSGNLHQLAPPPDPTWK